MNECSESSAAAQGLCLACGLCCNGAIFATVKLLPDEDPEPLLKAGLPVTAPRSRSQPNTPRKWSWPQPCPAHDGCRCSVYPLRPNHCRTFECLVLKDLQSGVLNQRQAIRLIDSTKRRVADVERLLRRLGECDTHVALGSRFRRVVKQFERGERGGQAAEVFGRLTVAFHGLNVMLQSRFYPAAGKQAVIATGHKEA